MTFPAERWIERLACLWLIGSVVLFVIFSWHWPLTGDASLMHYVVFLTHHGMQPYREIVEMNLPASYLIEKTAMAVFGPDSLGCRLYDLFLLAVCSLSLFVMVKPRGRLAAVLAASLFALIHGRDGPLMTAERDLAATGLLLATVAIVFTMSRRDAGRLSTTACSLLAGAAATMAATIKPTLFPFVAGLLVWSVWVSQRQKRPLKHLFVPAAAGALLSTCMSVGFLVQHQATKAFWAELHGLIPYHASLDNQSISHLLHHSISPLLPMLLFWLAAVYLLRHETLDRERIALILFSACGLLSYLLQGKAFWYQRYPFIAFILPLFVIDFARLMRSRSWTRYVGTAGLACGLILATGCLLHLKNYDREEPPRQVLQDLSSFGTPAELSGRIQCMDTIGGCIDALYHARIVQSTGFIYDCYMLDGKNRVTLDLRRRFWQQMGRNPPRVIVITDSNCYGLNHTFDRFAGWPEFQSYLGANYSLARESGPLPPLNYWSHPMDAYRYRIYIRQ